MKLSQLMRHCQISRTFAPKDCLDFDPEISSIHSNSKSVQPGSVFVAVKGLAADGHDYMEQALEKGAAAIIAQHNPRKLSQVVLVENSRTALAHSAAAFYGHPSNELKLIGITGTNGKTTVTWLLESIFKACGYATGVIGTVDIRYAGKTMDNPYTTPDAIALQKTLRDMKTAGITHVIMEVSSHGLELNRVDGCCFAAGVFTNLTQDHLDFHPDMDAYFNSKKRFFTQFLGCGSPANAPAVLNLDDPKGQILFSSLNGTTIGVSARQPAHVYSKSVIDTLSGLSGILICNTDAHPFSSPLTGTFNLENILCAAGAAYALGVSIQTIAAGIANCGSVPGRLEKIPNPLERHLFVDYAHTPDALESVLNTLKQRAGKRMITVFGCGGDRDRKKRPIMGTVACRYSDIAILTSDNPRSEPPEAIIKDILDGMTRFDALSRNDLLTHPFHKGYLVEPDRKKAIDLAIEISKPGDVVLVAGKGHETYQITNSGTIHFDDREQLQSAVQLFYNRFKPMEWSCKDLFTALEIPAVSPDRCDRFSGISIDSRSIAPDQVFVALAGERFDGHDFVNDLIKKGIQAFVVNADADLNLDEQAKQKIKETQPLFCQTSDTLEALGKLARFQRLRSNAKIAAITGSSGKTTTRKILQEIFNTRFHTLATQGNLNNEIGLPLTLLNLSASHEWAVVEMGMNHPGELSRMSWIARPDIAMVLNTAAVHLEGVGSIENVAKAKAEIFQGLGRGSTAVIFADDKQRHILESLACENRQIQNLLFFGSDPLADITLVNMICGPAAIDFKVEINGQAAGFSIPSPARFMVNNCLGAISVAMAAGIDIQCMQKGISAFTPEYGRLNIQQLSPGVTLIDDTYNANPSSMEQALYTLAELSSGSTRIAIIGDMLELGSQAAKLHRSIGKTVVETGISQLFVCGEMTAHLVDGAIENGFSPDQIFCFDKSQIAGKIAGTIHSDTWILVKGSRGMAMETIVQDLQQLLTLKA